jgi:hypothetical protein
MALTGCGLAARQQQQAQLEAQRQHFATGEQDCKTRFPTTRTSKNHADFAKCIVDVENSDPPSVTYPDLLRLKQTYYVLIASKVDQGTLTPEQANVQNAQIQSQIESEGLKRSSEARLVGAQEQAADAERQAAFAQSLSAFTATMPKTSSSASVNCTTTGPYAMRTTNCY